MNIDLLQTSSSNDLEETFLSTYSSLQLILCQMQMKLAGMFLHETEYLQQREEQLQRDEQIVEQRVKSLQQIQFEREQLEDDFSQLQHRLESAVVHVIQFQTNGVRKKIIRENFNLVISDRNSSIIIQ